MIALSMVLRSHPMSLGGVFMMLSCLVMRVLCLGIDISTLLNPLQVMNHASSHPAQAGVDYSSASRQLPRARVIIIWSCGSVWSGIFTRGMLNFRTMAFKLGRHMSDRSNFCLPAAGPARALVLEAPEFTAFVSFVYTPF